jgi:hypothetical protein
MYADLGSKHVYGFPSSLHFSSRYKWDLLYMYYIVSIISRPQHQYPNQANRITSSCISFGTSEDDHATLDTQGTNRIVEDTLNFVGNATLSTNSARFVFQGRTSDFGDRLATAQQLNGPSIKRDSQASALFNALMSNPPLIPLREMDMALSAADMDGNLFSFDDMLVYSGIFNIAQSSIRLNGTLETHMISQVKANLRNVQVNVQSDNSSSRIEIAIGGGSLEFQNWNATLSSNIQLSRGRSHFRGQSVELNTCDTPPSPPPRVSSYPSSGNANVSSFIFLILNLVL